MSSEEEALEEAFEEMKKSIDEQIDVQSSLIQYYVEPSLVPSSVIATFWSLFNKVLALGNLNEKDIKRLRILRNIVEKFYVMMQPPHKITWEELFHLTQSKIYFEASLTRGRGGFERRQQVTTERRIHLAPRKEKKGFWEKIKEGEE